MDLEQLNKSQIVLLTMLVSFVTSIATGIVTVSLVEKAPADVTRVVQRVVERTVERVSPAEGQQAAVVTKEETVIVRESDLISAAVKQNTPRLVAIRETPDDAVIALGVRLGQSGAIVTDASALPSATSSYALSVDPDTSTPARVSTTGGARDVALLTPEELFDVEAVVPSETAVQVGQTVVAFINENGAIAQGIVSDVGDGGHIKTTIGASSVMPGSVIIDVDGEVVGMSTGASRTEDDAVFVPVRALVALTSASQEEGGEPGDTETATSTPAESDAAGSAQ